MIKMKSIFALILNCMLLSLIILSNAKNQLHGSFDEKGIKRIRRQSHRRMEETDAVSRSITGSNLSRNSSTLLFNSTLYIASCSRGYGLANHLPALLANIDVLASFWTDWRLCIYVDEDAAEVILSMNHTNIDIIYQAHVLPNGKYRTERISAGRNACLHHVRSLVEKSHHTLENSYFAVMDMDDVNVSPFRADVISGGLQNLEEWDVLTFNREPYYDFWAARYAGYDKNIFQDAGTRAEVGAWKQFGMHKYFGTDVLDVSPLLYFPVYSAFNGIAIYKLNYTQHCTYNWEFEGWHNEKYREECEHVPFNKCIIAKHDGKVRIYNKKILDAKETYSAEQLAKYAINFTIPEGKPLNGKQQIGQFS